MRRSVLATLLAVAVAGGAPAAQAATAHKSPPEDPWEQFNRAGFAVATALDRLIVRPAALLFRHLTPGPLGEAVHNLVVNLSEPDIFVNDMLQGRVQRAGTTAGRFLANSTVGLAGLMDVAKGWGLNHHDNDFGETLGRWGARPGPYLFVPFVGPSTLRDMVGEGVDIFIDPVHFANYANRAELSFVRAVVGGLDKRIMNDADLKALTEGAADPYASLRSVYLQHREGEIRGSEAPAIESLPSFDDPAPSASAPATAGATPVEDTPPPAPSDTQPPASSAPSDAPAAGPAVAPEP